MLEFKPYIFSDLKLIFFKLSSSFNFYVTLTLQVTSMSIVIVLPSYRFDRFIVFNSIVMVGTWACKILPLKSLSCATCAQ